MRQKGCVLPLNNCFRICSLREGWNKMPLNVVCIICKGSRPVFPSVGVPTLNSAVPWLCWGTRQRSKTVQRVTSTTAASHLLFTHICPGTCASTRRRVLWGKGAVVCGSSVNLVEFVGYLCHGHFQK